MRDRPKPKVGQILYRLNTGNNAIYVPQVLTPVVVSKVGRKYFTVKKQDSTSGFESEHYLDGWYEKTDYSANYVLYESPQVWEDEKEAKVLCDRIEKAFKYGHNPNLSVAALRRIVGIVEKEREP